MQPQGAPKRLPLEVGGRRGTGAGAPAGPHLHHLHHLQPHQMLPPGHLGQPPQQLAGAYFPPPPRAPAPEHGQSAQAARQDPAPARTHHWTPAYGAPPYLTLQQAAYGSSPGGGGYHPGAPLPQTMPLARPIGGV